VTERGAFFTASSTTLFIGACRILASNQELVHRADSAGIEIVENAGSDRGLPWKLLEVRRVRGQDSSWLALRDPAFASADLRGRIYVLQQDDRQVLILDTLGRRLLVLGRTGEDTESLKFPVRVDLGVDGALGVLDFGRRALVLFDTGGRMIGARPFSEIGAPGRRVYLLDSTSVLRDETSYSGTEAIERLLYFGPDTAVLAMIRTSSRGDASFQCGVTFRGLALLFSPTLSWTVGAGVTAVTRQSTYEIQLFVKQRLVRSIRRRLVAMPATDADVPRAYPRGWTIGHGQCRVQPEELTAALGVAPTLPLIQGLQVAPDSSLWVERFTFAGEPPRVDVFSLTGAYRGTLVGTSLPVGFLPKGQFLAAPPDAVRGGRMLLVRRLLPAPWQ
jgi:hypothetical protein